MRDLRTLPRRPEILQSAREEPRDGAFGQHLHLLRQEVAEPERVEEAHQVRPRDVEEASVPVLREELQAAAQPAGPRGGDAHAARSLRLQLLFEDFVSS